MLISTLLDYLNSVDHSTAVNYMDANYGPTNPFIDKMEWLIDVERHGRIEVATIKLVQGRFLVESFIHKFMEIRELFTVYEAIQRIELGFGLSLELNLN